LAEVAFSLRSTAYILIRVSKSKPTTIVPDQNRFLLFLYIEVPISKSFKNIADVIEKTNRGTPITPLNSPAAALPSK